MSLILWAFYFLFALQFSLWLLSLAAPKWGYVFWSVHLLVCLSVCLLSYERNLLKLLGKEGGGPRLDRVATNLENLKYSGISLSMENSGNSVQPQGQIVTNKVFSYVIQIFVFPGTVRTWPLKIFWKEGVARVTWPPNFWALNTNSSKMVKATDFKFYARVSRDSPDMAS